MTPALFVIAILMVLVVWGVRGRRTRGRYRRYHQKEGRCLARPWRVHSRRAMRERAQETRCACGGPLVLRSEGEVHDAPEVQVVGSECRLCEEKVRMYFVIEYPQ